VTDAEIRARNLECLTKAFAGISAADADQMLANYTEDLILEMPLVEGARVVEGREKIRKFLRATFKNLQFRLQITAVHETVDPEMAVVEYVSEGVAPLTGKPYANVYIGVYWFRDGLIYHVKEFFDPTRATEALTPG
jgi:ketosteroid isomerase-like protein